MGRNKDEKLKASGLQKYFQNFEVIVIITVETKILNYLQIVSLSLQQPDIDLMKTFGLLKTALHKIQEMRDNFDQINEESKVLAKTWGVHSNFTKIRKKISPRMFDELSCDEREHDSEKYFKTQIYFRTLDIIMQQLNQGFSGTNQIVNIFNSLIPRNIYKMNENELKDSAFTLVNHYLQ